jgi:NDP-sugar pyrophosphorylase family protein
MRSLWNRLSKDWRKNVVLNYKNVHPTAQVHPTAVVEGSIIGPHAEIGAHCVVRYSYIGENVTLHDGAKVEFSVVGNHSWLMHDLVLVRSLTEDHVFLIHGPYQFSYFQSGSSAFATILMDYRPDAKPIQVKTSHGLKNYGGRFLGSVLKEGAKILGGTLLAPGRIVPENTWLGVPSDDIHLIENENLPQDRALAPEETKRRSYESIAE